MLQPGGGDRLLLISTLSVGRRAAQHGRAIEAAKRAGVKRIVYTSTGGMQDGNPAIVVNTGSKQGITTPPGNLAYNVSKAAVKTYTEGLAHALRNIGRAAITAHLLIAGFTFTGLTTGASLRLPKARPMK